MYDIIIHTQCKQSCMTSSFVQSATKWRWPFCITRSFISTGCDGFEWHHHSYTVQVAIFMTSSPLYSVSDHFVWLLYSYTVMVAFLYATIICIQWKRPFCMTSSFIESRSGHFCMTSSVIHGVSSHFVAQESSCRGRSCPKDPLPHKKTPVLYMAHDRYGQPFCATSLPHNGGRHFEWHHSDAAILESALSDTVNICIPVGST